MLEYVLTEPQSYCLVIGRGTAQLVKLPSKAQIEPLVDRFVQELRSRQERVARSGRTICTTPCLKPNPGGADNTTPVHRSRRQAAPARVRCAPEAECGRLAHCLDCAVSERLRPASQPRRPVTRPERALLGVGGVPYDRMFAAGKPAGAASRSDETRGLFDASYPTQLPVLPTAQGEVLTAARSARTNERRLHRRSGDGIGLEGAEVRRLRRLALCRARVRRSEISGSSGARPAERPRRRRRWPAAAAGDRAIQTERRSRRLVGLRHGGRSDTGPGGCAQHRARVPARRRAIGHHDAVGGRAMQRRRR